MAKIANPKPLNIAHRGGADLWPENTLEAFEKAIAIGVDGIGVDGIELDVQLSADGQLMVHHDARLNPDATRLGGAFIEKPGPRIDALSGAALSQYDVGRLDPNSAYGQRRAQRQSIDGSRIPTLGAVERLIGETARPDFKLYTELKTDMQADRQQSDRLAEAYLAALAASPIAAHHIVVSFDWRCINAVRASRPDMAHAYTTPAFSASAANHPSAAQNAAPWCDGMDWRDMDGAGYGEKVLRAIHAGGGTGWFAYWRDVTPENMALAEDLGLRVSAWTVNHPQDMRALAALGVAALVTDRPDILSTL